MTTLYLTTSLALTGYSIALGRDGWALCASGLALFALERALAAHGVPW